jgi:aminoglycoside phosphotransferase (APT) family kinase protein
LPAKTDESMSKKASRSELEAQDINASLVARLIAGQFPQWSGLPISRVDPGGWDNRMFRLGADMVVRLPSAAAYAPQVEKEQYWLPRLRRGLPVAIPVPLAMGRPAEGYPWHWSIYQWLPGNSVGNERNIDLERFAVELGRFLIALQRIDIAGAPRPGTDNFWRGGPLKVYDAEARQAMAALEREIDTGALLRTWQDALDSTWRGPPVWVHGDVSPDNLLVENGALTAALDFGCLAVGDPACDLAIAWTLFEPRSRSALRAALPLDAATWVRGKGWAVWKATILLAQREPPEASRIARARRVVEEVLMEERYSPTRPSSGR